MLDPDELSQARVFLTELSSEQLGALAQVLRPAVAAGLAGRHSEALVALIDAQLAEREQSAIAA